MSGQNIEVSITNLGIITDQFKKLFKLLDFIISHSCFCLHLVRETYQRLFNKTPNIQIIHAGLECGLFKKPYPEMDMVSIGPTITGPHSPDEQVHIESVGHYWTLLTELLKEIPAK